MSWDEVALNEVCDLKNGYAFKSTDYIVSSNTLNCRMSNIRPGGDFDVNYNPKYLPDEYVEKYKSYLLKDGDVIIAMTDMANEPKILGVPTVVETEGKNLLLNQRVGKLVILDDQRVFFPYLKLVLNQKWIRKYYQKFAGGGLQINLGKEDLLSVKIPLPPLEEQKRIAEILIKADAIRRKRQQAINIYDQILRSVFLYRFGDPVANPMEWDVEKLKNLSTKILSGSTPKGGSKVYVEKGILFLRSQNVWKNNLVLDDIAYIDEVTHSKMSKSSLKKNDLLMTKTGRINTENSSLGRAAMYLGEDDKANVNGHVYLIRLQEEIVKEFVLHILTTSEYREYIRSICVGGIDKRQINKVHLENFPIINPPVEMQYKFAALIQAVDEQKKQAKESLIKYEELFSSLSQKAFRGELMKSYKAA